MGVVNFLTFCLSVDEDAGAQNLKMDMEPINPACEVTRCKHRTSHTDLIVYTEMFRFLTGL